MVYIDIYDDGEVSEFDVFMDVNTRLKNIDLKKSISGNIYIKSFLKGNEVLSKKREELLEDKLLLNWYKVTENGSTKANGAKFKIKVLDSANKKVGWLSGTEGSYKYNNSNWNIRLRR